jgi:hypothetical protein
MLNGDEFCTTYIKRKRRPSILAFMESSQTENHLPHAYELGPHHLRFLAHRLSRIRWGIMEAVDVMESGEGHVRGWPPEKALRMELRGFCQVISAQTLKSVPDDGLEEAQAALTSILFEVDSVLAVMRQYQDVHSEEIALQLNSLSVIRDFALINLARIRTFAELQVGRRAELDSNS